MNRYPSLIYIDSHQEFWFTSQYIVQHQNLNSGFTSLRAGSDCFQLGYRLQRLLNYNVRSVIMDDVPNARDFDSSDVRIRLERIHGANTCGVCNQGCHFPLVRRQTEGLEKVPRLVLLWTNQVGRPACLTMTILTSNMPCIASMEHRRAPNSLEIASSRFHSGFSAQ